MEEKDLPASDGVQPDKPVEETPQPPTDATIQSTDRHTDQSISRQEPAPETIKQSEGEETVTYNSPPVTEKDMEVHHHSHSHGKKNWKAYFWEFLMLFLAVFCGFLAEYQLEHKIESDREKVYMKNLLEDLKSDTTAYKNYARDNILRFSTIDSLMYLLKSPESKTRVNRIYFLARTLTMGADLLFANERTYDQMKSSGQLRLIHNQKVSDSISSYYNSLKQIANQNNRITDRVNHYFLTVNKLFDAAVLMKIFKERKEPEDKSIKLLTEDPMIINEFLTRVQYLYGTFSFAQNFGLERCRAAESLIALIKKEYHLE